MRSTILIIAVLLLSACIPKDAVDFDNELFCKNKQAFIIKYHIGNGLYRFDRTPAADELCKDTK